MGKNEKIKSSHSKAVSRKNMRAASETRIFGNSDAVSVFLKSGTLALLGLGAFFSIGETELFAQIRKAGQNSSASSVPSDFTKPGATVGTPAAGLVSQNQPSNESGWTPIGTSYATPSSSMPPDASVTRILSPPSRSYNPSSKSPAGSSSVPASTGRTVPDSGSDSAPPPAPAVLSHTSAFPSPPANSGTAQGIPAGSGSSAGSGTAGSGSSVVSVNPGSSGTSVTPAAGSGTAGAGTSSLPAPFPVNQKLFQLPFENFLSVVPPQNLREVRLYVSRNNGANWSLYQTLSPERIQKLPHKNFDVRTASDGEFWFSVQIVDKNGTEMPRDYSTPTWRILVNSEGKPLESLMNRPGSGTQTGQGGSSASSLTPPQTNPLANSAASGSSGGNPGTNSNVNPNALVRPQWSPDPNASGTNANSANVSGTPNGKRSQNPNIVVFSVKDRGERSIPDVSLPVYKIQTAPGEAFQQFAKNTQSAKEKRAHTAAKPDSGTGSGSGADADSSSPGLSDSIQLDDGAPALESSAPEEGGEMLLLGNESTMNEEGIHSRIRYVNQPELTVDYDISTVGSSGVGRVELWGTLDDGQTWTYMAEDKDCTSPLQVNLNSDGKYGFQILIFNGAGVGMERPQSGSAPQLEVVLDRLNPRIQLYEIQLQAEFGDLEIEWQADDLNFGSNPILLSWSSSTEGPWRSMSALPLENTGRYTWRIPKGVPGKVFIRMDVCDQAKNSATLVTGPVVTDIVRPTGVILDAAPQK